LPDSPRPIQQPPGRYLRRSTRLLLDRLRRRPVGQLRRRLVGQLLHCAHLLITMVSSRRFTPRRTTRAKASRSPSTRARTYSSCFPVGCSRTLSRSLTPIVHSTSSRIARRTMAAIWRTGMQTSQAHCRKLMDISYPAPSRSISTAPADHIVAHDATLLGLSGQIGLSDNANLRYIRSAVVRGLYV
jgi:hypothetical protein